MPFPGDITALPNGTILLSVAAALLYGLAREATPSWRRTLVKTAAVGLLAVLSYLVGGPWLLTVGLALGALGDAALSRDGERAFLAGLVAFLLAHLAYVALFATRWWSFDLLTAEPWRPAVGVAIVALVAIMLRRLLPAVGGEMRLPVCSYVMAIMLMGLAALGVPGWAAPAGAVLFILSDTTLATEKFLLPGESPHRAWTGLAVWILYYLGQLLIALAFLL